MYTDIKNLMAKIVKMAINARYLSTFTVMPAKSDSDFMFCLQCYQGLIINRSLVY